ncbi:peptidase M48 [Rhodoferax koreense]|uniref:Peptidase M48 n=1 Tax=Rhodoferax koreensis TaxID=1842727 RepID=A0A1P8K2P7_9BURK|nr:M48 family metalloprotease [Rhodoferax koreense]APW40283.1 peptidase M48 [Rhodoferax koreense]
MLSIASLVLPSAPSRAQTSAPPASVSQLPTLGDGSDMTSAAERRLGERIAREIYRDPDYIDDPVLVEYVQTIWQALLDAARARGELSAELDQRFAWEIMMGRDRTINAFALPGGYLGLNLGLVGVVTSPDELASVLAHELSHVTQRHISRLMAQQGKQMPWLIGAMILGALAASKNPDAGNAMIVGGQAAVAQNGLNFSRDMEREADRVGFGVMTQAGFAPQGFVSMFEKLQQASRLNDNGAFPYLRSHPLTTERIADMQSRQVLDARPAAAPPNIPTGLVHAMMAARARVLTRPGIDVLRSWLADAQAMARGTVPVDARSVGVLYAGATAGLQQRDFVAARALAARLTALTAGDAPAQRLAKLLAAEVEWNAGDLAATAGFIDANAPGRPELILGSQLRVRTGQARQAATRLQTWVSLNPRDGTAWQLLASAYAAQGLLLRSVHAEAEMQVARLDYQAALDRFKAAQDLVRKPPPGAGPIDHIEASIIDTRTREVEAIVKEQAKEKPL